MRQQLYKGMTMIAVMAVVTLVLAAGSANAQSSRRVTANVPFEFIVGNKTFEAGDYEVNAATLGAEAMVIRNEDSRRAITRLTNPIVTMSPKSSARLVFHKYGDTYFLAEVWSGGDYNGRQLLESKRERSLRHEMRALAQAQFERVELVAVLR